MGLILGEMLNLPCISLAKEISFEDGSVVVKKSVPVGYEKVKAPLPALVTVSNEVGELRYISRTKMLKMMRGAGSIPTWTSEDISVAEDTLQKMSIATLSSPPDMGRDCRFLEGSVDEMAAKLAEVFMALK